jgi:hypothetical protein
MNFKFNNNLNNSSDYRNKITNSTQSKSYEISSLKKFGENQNQNNNNNMNDNTDINNKINESTKIQIQEKHSKTQSRMDIQSIVDMCSKKLDIDPIHKKALLLRASSYIKNKDFDNVKNKIK